MIINVNKLIHPEEGGITFFRNVRIKPQNYTALQPRRRLLEWIEVDEDFRGCGHGMSFKVLSQYLFSRLR